MAGSFSHPFIDNDYHYDIVTDVSTHCRAPGTHAHVDNAMARLVEFDEIGHINGNKE